MTSAALEPFVLSAEAWAEILACRARLRLPRLLRAEPLLRREIPSPREARAEACEVALGPLLAAFDRALRAQPGPPGCLPRALALRRFLARHGQSSRLGLGLRKAGRRFRGHAWVEAEGVIVSRDEAFARTFLRLESGGEGRSGFRRADG